MRREKRNSPLAGLVAAGSVLVAVLAAVPSHPAAGAAHGGPHTAVVARPLPWETSQGTAGSPTAGHETPPALHTCEPPACIDLTR